MKVLLVNQYFPPDSSATARVFSDLVGALEARGHQVTVLCGRPSYDPAPSGKAPTVSARVIRVPSTVFDRRGGLGRAINYLTFLCAATIRGVLLRGHDVVLCGTDPPLAIWIGLLSRRGRPVVYSVQDLHPDAALAGGWMRSGRSARLWDRAHRAALRRADLVVPVSAAMARRLTSKGVAEDRVRVVANGGHPPSGPPDDEVVRSLRGEAGFIVVHAGNLGVAGAWETLTNAARMLDGDVTFLFVGGGAATEDLAGPGVKLTPFRPPAEIPSVMAAGDMQLVTMRAGMEGLLLPSKIYTILAHSRPVLAVVPAGCDIAELVSAHRCGLVVDPANPSDLVEKIEWARSHPSELSAMGRNAGAAFNDLDRSGCMGRLVTLLESVSHRPTEPSRRTRARDHHRNQRLSR